MKIFGAAIKSIGAFALLLMFAAQAGAAIPKPTPIRFDEVPLEAQEFVDRALYDSAKLKVEGTDFFLLTRKSGGLGMARMATAVSVGWPALQKTLPAKVPSATIIDFDAAFGGGPMGKFIVGVYTTDAIDSDFGKVMEQVTGWAPLRSSQEYISKYYGSFADPMQAYATDMVVHELGHLIFGFGLTDLPDLKDEDSWFCLGLGLVYDRAAWSNLGEKTSPLFDSIISVWSERFSTRADVDQRLIRPDQSRDAGLGLQRLQTYGHGKSLVYLRELRNRIGASAFDAAVLKYVSRPQGSSIRYDDFLKFLGTGYAELVNKVEAEFTVR